jgi:GT2 family glycosyltransferase
MLTVSIIIVSYNRSNDALELLKNIADFDNKHILKNIVVLNNGSTDEYSAVQSFIKESDLPIKYVIGNENLGASKGKSYASTFAEGDILFFLDDDTNIFDKQALLKVVKSFEDKNCDRKVGLVSYKVIYSSTQQVQISAFPHKKYSKYKDKHSFLTYFYPGGASAKLNQPWIDVGRYPDDIFYGMEEYDFSYRLLNAGYCIKYDDSLVVYHKESPGGRVSNSVKIRMMWVNKTKIAWRYLPKIFFYSTALIWSAEYLIKSKFNLSNFVLGWREILQIPKKEKRTPISKATLQYLQKVEARLLY